MSRGCCLAFALLWLSTSAFADDAALWKEYGLVRTTTGKQGKVSYTAYQMQDLTGALAAWEWQRASGGEPCNLASFCTEQPNRTVLFDDNYFVDFAATNPRRADVKAVLDSLAGKKETSLPAILTFLPRSGIVPDSSRYILGKASLAAFAPELGGVNLGFDQGAEGQVAQYVLAKGGPPVRLALFYYPTPGMARQHAAVVGKMPNVFVKRSGFLLAIVYGGATRQQADTLLSTVQYEAKITWNDVPPPPPIKPLYQLLLNILYMCVVLSCLCLTAGLLYGGMRVYRRRFGHLEEQEAMTTLHLQGD